MTMQALLLDRELSYRTDQPIPKPEAGEALIEMRLAGICATDLELAHGYAGFAGILGHEFIGQVVEVADANDRHWLGSRVVGSINIGCRLCPTCLTTGPSHCPTRRVLGIRAKDGAFADFFTLPVANLFRLPDHVADEAAVFAEPLAAALRVVEQLQDLPRGEIGVLGPGRLGLLIGRVLALAGHRVTMLGRSETSLTQPRRWGLQAGLAAEFPESGFSCVVDASGTASGFAAALRLLRAQGCLVLKSTFVADHPVDLSPLVVKEIRLLGSRCGRFEPALDRLSAGDIAVETLIDGVFPLSAGPAAFATAARPGVRKILLKR